VQVAVELVVTAATTGVKAVVVEKFSQALDLI
jgi:hypothetical protein